MSATGDPGTSRPPWWLAPLPDWLGRALPQGYQIDELTTDGDTVALVVRVGGQTRTLRLDVPGAHGSSFAVVPNIGRGPLYDSALPHCARIADALRDHADGVVALVNGQRWLAQLGRHGGTAETVAAAPDALSDRRARLLGVAEQLRRRPDPTRLQACRATLTELDVATLPDDDRAYVGLLWLALGDFDAGLAVFQDRQDGAGANSLERAALAVAGHALLGARAAALAVVEANVRRASTIGAGEADAVVAMELLARQCSALRADRPAASCWGAVASAVAPDLAADCLLERARAEGRMGDTAAATVALEAAIAASARGSGLRAVVRDQGGPSFALRAARVAIEVGAFVLAEQTLAQIADEEQEAALALAELWLFRGRWSQARERVAAFGSAHPKAALIEGVALLQQGEAAGAIEALAIAVADPAVRRTALVARAEARLALGAFEAAVEDLEASLRDGNSVVAHALLELVDLSATFAGRPLARFAARSTDADGFSGEQLEPLCRAAGVPLPGPDPASQAEALRAVLRAMGGNRTDRMTLRLGPDDALVVVEADNGRMAATTQLLRLMTQPADEVLAGFVEIARRYPRSPHPFTYQGELRLWIGDIDGALADFRRAIARKPCRWGYVGSSAACMLRGQTLRARWFAHLGRRKFPELSTATTVVYRGELARKRKRWAAARADLELATREKPTRIGAWMNLALTYDALGDHDARDRVCARLDTIAPAILWLASAQAGLTPSAKIRADRLHAVCESALAMMRGNRSSVLHTLYVGDELRVIPNPQLWSAHVVAWLPALSALLRARLARTAVGADASVDIADASGRP